MALKYTLSYTSHLTIWASAVLKNQDTALYQEGLCFAACKDLKSQLVLYLKCTKFDKLTKK